MKTYAKLLGLATAIVISAVSTPVAKAQTLNGWSLTLAGENSPIKLSYHQPGAYYGNPPHPLGLGSGSDWLDSAVANDPKPGSFGDESKERNWGVFIGASKTWPLDKSENLRAGIFLGGSWHPIHGDSAFGSITGKDVIHEGSGDCGCADVSDWRGNVRETFDGNLFSAYVGPRLEYSIALNKKHTVFLTPFVQGGASFNWLTGSGDYTESIYSSKNSTAETLADSRSGHFSGNDFNVGAFVMAGARLGGKHWGLEGGYRQDFRSNLDAGLVSAKTEGGTWILGFNYRW